MRKTGVTVGVGVGVSVGAGVAVGVGVSVGSALVGVLEGVRVCVACATTGVVGDAANARHNSRTISNDMQVNTNISKAAANKTTRYSVRDKSKVKSCPTERGDGSWAGAGGRLVSGGGLGVKSFTGLGKGAGGRPGCAPETPGAAMGASSGIGRPAGWETAFLNASTNSSAVW